MFNRKIKLTVKGDHMAQVVHCWSLRSEVQVQSQASPCGISVGQSGTEKGSSPITSVVPY